MIICATLLIPTATQCLTFKFWEYNNAEDAVLVKLNAYIKYTPEIIPLPNIIQHRDLYILNAKKRIARLFAQLKFTNQGHSKTKLKGYLEQEASLILGLISVICGKNIMAINKLAKYVFFIFPAASFALFLDGKRNVNNSVYDTKDIYNQLMDTQSLLFQLERFRPLNH